MAKNKDIGKLLLEKDAALDIIGELPADIRDREQKAENVILTRPGSIQLPQTTFWNVRVLGTARKQENPGWDGIGSKRAVADLAVLLAARGKPFSLGFHSVEDGAAAFLLGTDDAEGSETEALLQSVFGIAQVEGYKETVMVFSNSWCLCDYVRQDTEGIETPLPDGDIPAWMDALACTAVGFSCDVRLYFSPLNQKWLDSQIVQTCDMLSDFSRYLKSSIQVSANTGESAEIEKQQAGLTGAIGEIWDGVKGKDAAIRFNPDSHGTAISENLEEEHSRVALTYNALKCYLKRLEWMKRDGGWCVSVGVSSQRPEMREAAKGILGALLRKQGYRCSWREIICGNSSESEVLPVGAVVPANRLAGFVDFPKTGFPGFDLQELHSLGVSFDGRTHSGKDAVVIGTLVWNEKVIELPLIIPYDQLNRHVFVCGMTGSGKSNTVCTLLDALGADIPFMVVEPVKGEYRALRRKAKNIEVYTMEAGGPEQLRMNPFWFPPGGRLQYHIDSLRTIIASAFELSAAMPNILEQCLTNVYVKLGWNIATSKNIFQDKLPEEKLYPTFSMLCSEIEHFLEKADFGPELKGNYKGAMLSRLQTFTNGAKGMLLDCSAKPRFQQWIDNKTSCIIELDALADDADKAIVMGVILSQYFQCVKVRGTVAASGLKHIIVLEEAHHLFKNTESSQSTGDVSKRHLVEMLSNVLAEIRAYGEGIFIVDQSPTSVSPQVIKNTAVKIIHRVDYETDLSVLQHTLLLEDSDFYVPASLACGKALIRYGSMHRPVHASMRLCEEKEAAGIPGLCVMRRADAQNFLDVLRTDVTVFAKIKLKCSRFINHLLFDGMPETICALQLLSDDIKKCAVNCGYDQRNIEILNNEDMEYVIQNIIGISLADRYPNQYLLCAQLRFSAERFLALQLLKKNGITEREWHMIMEYHSKEILPAMAYFYDSGTNEEFRMISHYFESPHKKSLTGILQNMRSLAYQILDKNIGDSSSALVTLNKMLCMNPIEGVKALCRQNFLISPGTLSVGTCQTIWSAFRLCLREMESRLSE